MRARKEEATTIGGRLKKARSKRGLTFDDVYRDLKIHPNILESLEKDRIDHSIGDVYIKGFLKKYARYLGLEGEGMLSEFAEVPIFKEKEEDFVNLGGEKKPPLIIKNSFRKSLLPLTAAFAVLFTTSVIGYAGFRLFAELKDFGTKRVSSARPPTVRPLTTPFLIKNGEPLNLRVKTNDKVWLRVKSDGKIIFEHTLSKGNIESWKADDELELWVGRAEALDLTLNNRHLGSPGQGRIKKLIINRTGLKIEER